MGGGGADPAQTKHVFWMEKWISCISPDALNTQKSGVSSIVWNTHKAEDGED